MPIPYTLKHLLQDFVVEELSLMPEQAEGPYTYGKLKKHNLTTLQAIQILSKGTRIRLKDYGYAGNKDKKAITTQLISVKIRYPDQLERLQKFQDPRIDLTFVGKGNEHIRLGRLEGNQFCSIVRNLDHQPCMFTKIPNLFGPQRFSQNNAQIGRFIVKKQFADAAKLMDDPAVQRFLAKHPDEPIAAIQCLPKRLMALYVHAYQSLLFNEMVHTYLKWHSFADVENVELPLIGFGMDELADASVKKMVDAVLQKEGISERDFIIRQIPELSAEGGSRSLFLEVKNLVVSELEDDECFPGKKKCVLSFTLSKGCYATVVIDFLFNTEPTVSEAEGCMCP